MQHKDYYLQTFICIIELLKKLQNIQAAAFFKVA